MLKKRQEKKQKLICIAILTVIVVLEISLLLFFKFSPEKDNGQTPDAGSTAEATQTTGTATTESTTGQATSGTTAEETTSPVISTEKTVSQNSATSFYNGVKYRSPTAKTADIFKHGRTLMLLNKNYELPENFKWDLVYWSNGQSVDAMSLNSKSYDSVRAVDRAAYQPLKDMFAAADKAGVPLQLVSAYRSIDLQDRLFTRSVNSFINQGYSEAEAIKKANFSRTFTGTSEHNTGLGFDILQKGNFTLTESFENTEHFKWLCEHAEEFGFILRYDKNKIDKTGIMYEPWHFRYVGTDHAKKINEMHMCFEEYIEYLESRG